jgi:hypothetical protein
MKYSNFKSFMRAGLLKTIDDMKAIEKEPTPLWSTLTKQTREQAIKLGIGNEWEKERFAQLYLSTEETI